MNPMDPSRQGKGKRSHKRKAKNKPIATLSKRDRKQTSTVSSTRLSGLHILETSYKDTSDRAAEMITWLLAPCEVETFMNEYVEKKPLVVQRSDTEGGQHYYDGWFSTQVVHDLLKNHSLEFTTDVEVTKAGGEGAQRRVLCEKGRAEWTEVNRWIQDGATLRFVRPQLYHAELWRLGSVLEDFWGCTVGVNAVVIPERTLGISSHFDNADLFVMQLEGCSQWYLHAPQKNSDVLARSSSVILSQKEMGAVTMETTLQAGDLLYFPRGTIYKARCAEGTSLHLELSRGVGCTWYDLLERAIPRALSLAAEEDSSFRLSLPRDFLDYMGVIHAPCEGEEETDERRRTFIRTFLGYMETALMSLPFDASADQLGCEFIADRLPPLPPPPSETTTPTMNSKICLLSRQAVRLVVEEDAVVLYHAYSNSKTPRGKEPQAIEFPLDCAPVLEALIKEYPHYVPVSSLKLEKESERLELALSLHQHGIVVVK